MKMDLDEKAWTGRECYHPDWDILRAAARKRDGGLCKQCGSPDNLRGHHLAYVGDRKDWQYGKEFILTLCDRCHKKYHEKPGRRNREDLHFETEEEALQFINNVASKEFALVKKEEPKFEPVPLIEEMSVESELVDLFCGTPPKKKESFLRAAVPYDVWEKYDKMSRGLTKDFVVREALKFALEKDVFNERIVRFTAKAYK